MARIPARRALALVLLALLVTFALPPAPAAAAQRLSAASALSGNGWASPAFWQGLVAAIPHLGAPLARWLGSGCGMDPNGRPLCGAATLDADRGCGADPDGNPLCGAKTTGDRGCGIDPDGKPLCGATSVNLDSGCGADPNGQPLCGSH